MILSRREASLAAIGLAALAMPLAAKEQDDSIESLRALLQRHDRAFGEHDLDGVLATMTANAVLMGTGHGELWIGHEELGQAFRRMFEDFDKGQQSVETLWHDGDVGPQGAWLTAVCNVSFSKGSNKRTFGVNLSLVCVKESGEWRIRMMHISNPNEGV